MGITYIHHLHDSLNEVTPVPSGKVKWYDADKGFGFLTRDDGGEVFVHSSALPKGVEALKPGQKVEFGVAESRRGQQALSVRVIDQPPTLAKAVKGKAKRKKPDEMVVIVEDLIKLLDDISNSYQRGKHPDAAHAKKIATVLRAVADDLDA
ncbi:cold-shock protein [Microbispora siamensis]|uniref:Cold-shock protein n=1 Tax=Microbispora siamensis TaxID=564413 RepID=A0ABQ4GST3_9ACTN|nr:cold-shock protein [Microbispora siamensis]